VLAYGNHSSQAVLREQIQDLLYRVGQLRQFLHVGARVDAEDERGRARRRDGRQLVLARGELRYQFRGQVRLGDVLGVVRREVVPRQAEGADPQFGAVVDLAVRVEDDVARGGRAADWIVGQRRGRGAVGRELLERGVTGADGGDAAGRLEAGGGPAVEGEPGARLLLGGGDVPVLALHGSALVPKKVVE